MSLHRRCCCLPPCPPAIEVTLAGVDASAPCVDRLLGLGVGCTSPYSCITGVSSGVDGVYHVPRVVGPTYDGWCEFRADFDAPASFDQRDAINVFLGTFNCSGTPVRRDSTRMRLHARLNRGLVRELWVWSLDNGLASVPIAFFEGYGLAIGYDQTAPFDGCAANTCGRIMSGGSFRLRRSA